MCLLSDIFYSLTIVKLYDECNWMPVLLFTPPTLKLLCGVYQILMMVELIFHLKIEISEA